METVYPDYYPDFHCIGGRCQHNCCIGWEIDIDEETATRYCAEKGDLGDRLRRHIEWGETPHFILNEHERCPFLNKNNLCDIILAQGEEGLCEICRQHPRFRNELPERLEIGLGLCCEEAARRILGKKEPFDLIVTGFRSEPDAVLILRDACLDILRDRRIALRNRFGAMLSLCGITISQSCFEDARDVLIGLERMSEDWTRCLDFLEPIACSEAQSSFSEHMSDRTYEYENLACYLIFRYMANAWDCEEAALRAAFAVFSVLLIQAIGAGWYRCLGTFTFEDQAELCRLFSSEIEYSVENRDAILEWLSDYVIPQRSEGTISEESDCHEIR
jgi:lysine-N-methylase